MKKYLFFVFLVVLGAGSLSADPGLSEVGEAWLKAFRANDLEAMVALYAPDAVMYPPDATVAKGTDAIRANYAGFLKQFKVQDAKLLEAQHITSGDTACGWGRFAITVVPTAGGDPVQLEGRFSDVSKKINGKWLYIVDHASLNPPPPEAAK